MKLFGWFDWEDNTTSVNSLSIIVHPRIDLDKYAAGDEITANLPRYGQWKGVIVAISGE